MRLLLFLMMAVFAAPSAAMATPVCKTEIQRGVASWYGPGFEGQLTQNQEIFDSQLLSAAHPSLPFGSVVKVTNLRNARSVFVRVNDRGAFGGHRIIDLSQAAAEKIGMIDAGTAAVSLQACH